MTTQTDKSKEDSSAAIDVADSTAGAVPEDVTEELPASANAGAAAQLTEFEDSDYPYDKKISRKEYEEQKQALQVELLKVQRWVKESEQKIALLFEGRDAAGKGGTIKRFTEHLNPRGARVIALEKPTDEERKQWFFQRYVHHLPSGGEMRFFDRSWYNRAGVERVMGFCTPEEYLEFMRQAPQLEQMFVRSGILLFKYWFSVSQKEQAKRFESRKYDPLKQWKLSPIDEASISMWDKYTDAKEAMFCMQHFLSTVDYPDRDKKVVTGPDPKIVISGRQMVSRINQRKNFQP